MLVDTLPLPVTSASIPTAARDEDQLWLALSNSYVGHNRITETGPELLWVAAIRIDLVEHKGECSAGSRDSIHGNRVVVGMVTTTLPDLAQGANQSMPPENQWTSSVASVEHTGVGKVSQS